MKILIKIISIAYLIAFFSGCTQQNLTEPTKPKIDASLESVSTNSIKYIPNITSIALEWQGVEDAKVQGYYIYRTNMKADGKKLKELRH